MAFNLRRAEAGYNMDFAGHPEAAGRNRVTQPVEEW